MTRTAYSATTILVYYAAAVTHATKLATAMVCAVLTLIFVFAPAAVITAETREAMDCAPLNVRFRVLVPADWANVTRSFEVQLCAVFMLIVVLLRAAETTD